MTNHDTASANTKNSSNNYCWRRYRSSTIRPPSSNY